MAQPPPIFEVGDLVDGKYKIVSILGRGGYGEIYSCKDKETNDIVAVKIEKTDRNGNLLNEEEILNDLKSCQFVPKLLDSGVHKQKFNYIVMDLLSTNLSELRRRRKTGMFSLLTTAMLAIQMLRSLMEVHNAGYVHRDIKPGNFVLGKDENNRFVYIIDFGLSKRHINDDSQVIQKQKTARWVGSRRYMSINTHLRKDQGRRDDLWSLLYVLVEFCTGTLPWSNVQGAKNFEKVRDMKKAFNNERLVRGLPKQFLQFLNYIKTLKYETKPDYDFLHKLFMQLFVTSGGTDDTPYDWETPNTSINNSLVLKNENSNEEKYDSEDLLHNNNDSSEEKKIKHSKKSSSKKHLDPSSNEQITTQSNDHKKRRVCLVM